MACETRDYNGRFFCPRCGSPVFNRSEDEVGVNLGCLDAIDQLQPTYELWTSRREREFRAVAVASGDTGTLQLMDAETFALRWTVEIGGDADNVRYDGGAKQRHPVASSCLKSL